MVDQDPSTLLDYNQQRQIRSDPTFSKKPKSGAFKIRLGRFADEITAQIGQQREGQSAPASEEWKAVLKATTRLYEVEIIEREWANYLQLVPHHCLWR
jgi:hypothetical protein